MAIRDGDWELLSWDPESGRSTWIMERDGKTHLRHDYPVDKLIEQNKIRQNNASSGWKGDWHHVASVPLNMVHQTGLGEAVTQQDDKWLSKFLNDIENQHFRTKLGSV